MNKVTLLGILAAEPEIADAPGGPVARLKLLTRARSGDRNGGQEVQPLDHVIEVRKAAVVKAISGRLHGGSRVIVDGALSYIDHGGEFPQAVIVVEAGAHQVVFLDPDVVSMEGLRAS